MRARRVLVFALLATVAMFLFAVLSVEVGRVFVGDDDDVVFAPPPPLAVEVLIREREKTADAYFDSRAYARAVFYYKLAIAGYDELIALRNDSGVRSREEMEHLKRERQFVETKLAAASVGERLEEIAVTTR